ncbi:HD domain-containing protein [Candidatus Pacearchaeota archaeon]|nr:HD domain-containing protein [Candidatus Pacearchaeota archaeon]
MQLNMPVKLEEIVSDIKNIGGQSMLVGGAVIDTLQGNPIKDFDVEVYGLSLQKLGEVLEKHGKSSLVGQEFGIIKLRTDSFEYDFSVPRLENKVGLGHKDFEVEFQLSSGITPLEAAKRRDLTINSMFFDLDKKELTDPYNGQADLKNGVLRHTSNQFSDDPLRVLRIMQLLPRKGKTVYPETIELCKSMKDDYQYLAKERVFEEWDKLLLKSDNPSLGLQFLVDCDWITHYPELDKLRYTDQNLGWHPEGNVWNHNQLVIDNAAKLRHNLPDSWKSAYMFGCLLHDVGKPSTTLEDLTAHGHDEAGFEPARAFMKRITSDKKLISRAADLVKYHMRPGNHKRQGAGEKAWRRLHNKVPLNVIAYVSKADGCGRPGKNLEDVHETSNRALELFESYGPDPIPQVLMGRDLIQQGYVPGPIFGEMLKNAYDIQIDEGIDDKQELLTRIKELYE